MHDVIPTHTFNMPAVFSLDVGSLALNADFMVALDPCCLSANVNTLRLAS